jgi:HAD superfamily phosphoserine phosphatase-like hydrolase
MESVNRTIAIFDFDHTLIEGESFWAFLSFVVGWPRTIMAAVEGLALFAVQRITGKNVELRTFLKAHLLGRLIAGRRTDDFKPAIEKLRGWIVWKKPIHAALLDHHAKGHRIVIASGGLDIYLPELLKDLPHHAIICTTIGIQNGIVTGEMTFGNCVRDRKAELVTAYLAEHGGFTESWGYGNLPHDLPMLGVLKHRVVV